MPQISSHVFTHQLFWIKKKLFSRCQRFNFSFKNFTSKTFRVVDQKPFFMNIIIKLRNYLAMQRTLSHTYWTIRKLIFFFFIILLITRICPVILFGRHELEAGGEWRRRRSSPICFNRMLRDSNWCLHASDTVILTTRPATTEIANAFFYDIQRNWLFHSGVKEVFYSFVLSLPLFN